MSKQFLDFYVRISLTDLSLLTKSRLDLGNWKIFRDSTLQTFTKEVDFFGIKKFSFSNADRSLVIGM